MKKIIILLLALSCLIGVAGCGKKLNKVSDTGFYLDTVVTVTMYGVSESVLNQLFDEIERLEGAFSVSQATSEVSRINNGNGIVPVSDEMTKVIDKAIEISALTDGAFDITMEPLISLWNITGGLFGLSVLRQFFVIGSGIITALPMVFFAMGINHLPLTLTGMLQYLSPTFGLICSLILGETFSEKKLISFAFIWLGVILYSITVFCEKQKRT